ncbi:MAG: response regulator, partial [Cyanobacteria bacterium Co-bin8]|nr:response regulator [Cyanobacteria bacterium Co-bin8]
ILLVDDDSDTREVIAFILRQAGASLTQTASAAEALQAFSQSRFDLLVSYIGMPDQDGYQLIQQIRALSPADGGEICAIALTAYAGKSESLLSIAVGFQLHVAKPIESNQLIEAIVSPPHRFESGGVGCLL